jgi:hypothetical protein
MVLVTINNIRNEIFLCFVTSVILLYNSSVKLYSNKVKVHYFVIYIFRHLYISHNFNSNLWMVENILCEVFEM